MKLSMWSNYYGDLSLKDSLAKIAEAGIKYSELAGLSLFTSSQNVSRLIEDFQRHSSSIGIKTPQVHGSFGGQDHYLEPDSQEWNARLELFRKEIRVAGILKIPVMVYHPIWFAKTTKISLKKLRDANRLFYRELLPDLQKNKVSIALENISGICGTAKSLLELIDHIGGDRHLGICLDTSHLQAYSDGDAARFIRRAGSRLIATHFSDALLHGKRDMHLLPIFSQDGAGGWVNWAAIRDALEEIDYKHLFNLEVPGSGVNTPMPVREQRLNEYVKIMDAFFKNKF